MIGVIRSDGWWRFACGDVSHWIWFLDTQNMFYLMVKGLKMHILCTSHHCLVGSINHTAKIGKFCKFLSNVSKYVAVQKCVFGTDPNALFLCFSHSVKKKVWDKSEDIAPEKISFNFATYRIIAKANQPSGGKQNFFIFCRRSCLILKFINVEPTK